MPSDQKAQFLLDAIEDRKAVDPVLLDLRGKTLLFDFFLVCSGTSNVHIRAITDAVLEKAEDARIAKPRISGQENREWVLLDFGDVVLHVMDEENRARYKLEQFWSTPHPTGALPPTPDTVRTADAEEDEEEVDEDAAFFEDADTEVEPIDEDEEDALDQEGEGWELINLDELGEEEDEEEDEDGLDAPPRDGRR
jgi:ribosome-associated protein